MRTLLLVLRRRQRLIAGVVAAGTGIAVVAGLQVPPRYTAQASVMLEPRQSRVVDVEAVLGELPATEATVETQVRLVRSPSHVEDAVVELGLDRDPAFAAPRDGGGGRPGVALTLGEPWDRLLAWMPDGWLVATGVAEERTEAAGAAPAPVAGDPVGHAVDAVLEDLDVRREGASLVVGVAFTADDPAAAARVANGVADLYVRRSLEAKRAATDRAGGWITSRVDDLQAELEEAEGAVERFRSRNNLAGGERGANPSDAELADLNRDLVATRAQLAERRARLRLVREMAGRGESLETAPEVMASPRFLELWRKRSELARAETELRASYGERHPRLQGVVADLAALRREAEEEVGRIVRNLENEAEVLQLRVAAVEGEIRRSRGSNAASREAEVGLRELERRAEAVRRLYEGLLQRQQETREQGGIVEADARVIARARPPERPSSRGPASFALAGLVLSSALAGALVYVLERLDRGVRSGKQVEQEFGVPCLGLVPKLPPAVFKGARRPHLYLLSKPLSTYAETVGSVHAALRLANVDAPPRVVQVTSAVPAEGKTVFAASLAASLVQAGRSVLLVDLDLRHPSVAREVAGIGDGGLMPYLAGEAGVDEAVRRDEAGGFDVVHLRRPPQNPAALLGSRRLRTLVEELRHRYDHVVVDSAPVLGMRDSKLVSELVDATLLLVRWEETTRDAVADALKELAEVRAPLAGVVIAQVDVERHARYGYGGIDGYYSKYKYYYVD